MLQEKMPSLLKPHVSAPMAAGFSKCSLMVLVHSFEPLMANYKQLPPQRGEPPWRQGYMDKMAVSESANSQTVSESTSELIRSPYSTTSHLALATQCRHQRAEDSVYPAEPVLGLHNHPLLQRPQHRKASSPVASPSVSLPQPGMPLFLGTMNKQPSVQQQSFSRLYPHHSL